VIPLDRIDERFRNDPQFKAVVDLLTGTILKLEMGPSEIREAAMYASYRAEMLMPKANRSDATTGRRIDGAPIAAEVHRANMAKVGGPKSPTGKQLKPPGWTPPDIFGELKRQGWEP
jgi:hypothetical protein